MKLKSMLIFIAIMMISRLTKSKRKSNKMVVNNTKSLLNIKNKGLLSIEKILLICGEALYSKFQTKQIFYYIRFKSIAWCIICKICKTNSKSVGLYLILQQL